MVPRARRAYWLGGIATATCLAVALLAANPSTAADQPSCGDVLASDTTLESDLTDCPGSALVIGADGVTLDLNGHTVSSTCATTFCPETAVIDGRGGYDGVRVVNGTVRPNGVGAGIALAGSDGALLERLTVNLFPAVAGQETVAVSLEDSNRNQLADSTLTGGGPAVMLSASDHNRISQSSIEGGIGIHVGDGVQLVDGSDENKLVNDTITAEGAGVLVFGSTDNQVSRSSVTTFAEAIGLVDARRTLISRNELSGGPPGTPAVQMFTHSSQNAIRRNVANGGLVVRGDDNLVEANEVDSFGAGIDIVTGDSNLVRKNDARAFDDAIAVRSPATETVLRRNLATESFDDGIDVDAAGTLIRGNTANDNGDLGIEAVAEVIDGGGNRASGNGNPLQCLNVVCR